MEQLIETMDVASNDNCTHVRGNEMWKIRDYNAFWVRYCELKNTGADINLYESISHYLPIVADFKLECSYEEDFIIAIVFVYQQVIYEMFDVSESKMELLCCHLESEGNEFRIQFPYCRVSISLFGLIREKAIVHLKNKNVLLKVRGLITTDWELIISKTINTHNFDLSRIYDIIHHDEGHELAIENIFNPDNHTHARKKLLDVSVNVNIYFWTPLFLSFSYLNNITYPDNIRMDPFDLLSMFSFNHLTDQRIGSIIFNYYKGSNEGLKLWTSFNLISKIRNEEQSRACWVKGKEKMDVLARYARMDSPVQYQKWHMKIYQTSFMEALSFLHTDVAKFFYNVNWIDLKYSDTKWYAYKDDQWIKITANNVIINKIFTRTVKLCEEWREDVCKQYDMSKNDLDKQALEIKIKRIAILIKKLKTTDYKRNILRESKYFFHVDTI